MFRDVWRVDRAGSLRRLRRQREPLPAPAAGEARVRVQAIGLNFADIFACLGLYSATPKGAFIPGLEFAGVVEELGPFAGSGSRGDATLSPGDSVLGVTRFGAYATAITAPVSLLARLPDGWDAAAGAAFPAQALTAWYGLVELARIGSNDLVVVSSAAGGVGLNALAILRSIGARVIATVGREDKRRFLVEEQGLPADLVIVRDRRRFGGQLDRVLQRIGADGFDCVFDAVAGPFFTPLLQRLRARGRFVLYGAADFMPRGRTIADPRMIARYLRRPRVDPLSLIAENRSLMGFNLIWLWDQAHRLPGAYASLFAMSPRPPYIGARFPFDAAPEALRFLQSGRSVGKVILVTG